MNPAPDITQARWIVNQQLVRGINLFEFMFFMSSSEGRGGARGYMADESFPSLMAYTNRASYLLAQGKPAAQIAVYFPTSSLWLGHNESEKSGFEIAQQLLESQHDFDFIDDYTLSTSLNNSGKITNKSGQAYRAVIVPSITTMSQSAYHNLLEASKHGMKLIFTDRSTQIALTDKSFMQAETLPRISGNYPSSNAPAYSFSALPWDVKLDQPSTSIKYLHRKWKDADLYFFFNESGQELSRNITVKGNGEAHEWNAQTGTIQNIKVTSAGNSSIQLNVDLKPYETKFIVIGE
jgi:hypothetical protein